MRIRTIKPEFWSSETLAPLSDKAKLLAIGLLNFSDDEGYFTANPLLIRAAVFPFDDASTTLRRLLDDLSRVGYLQIGKSPDGKEIGRVVNFAIHQKIDRPKDSKLKQNVQFDDASTTLRRRIDDASPLEQGTGNREQGKEQEGEKQRASLPPSAPVQEVHEAWNALEGLPKCLLVSDKRRRTLQVRLGEPFFAAHWREAMAKVQASRFCRGENERGWKATFDWFISPDAAVKVMEGKYETNGVQKPATPQSRRNDY